MAEEFLNAAEVGAVFEKVRGGDHSISATLTGPRAQQRIVNIDGVPFDVPPADHMVVVTNDDRPGVIGTVGTLLGAAEINIADMDVSRVEDGSTAVMLIAPSQLIGPDVIEQLRQAPGVLDIVTLAV